MIHKAFNAMAYGLRTVAKVISDLPSPKTLELMANIVEQIGGTFQPQPALQPVRVRRDEPQQRPHV